MSFYHTVDVGGGRVLHGRYDHRPVLSAYGLPDLCGKRVIDVGRATGFFSFEFERRGAAHVVAVDLPPARSKTMPALASNDIAANTVGRLDFFICHALLRSRVEPVWCDANELAPEIVGDNFDVAFIGSLLVHLSDPIGCLARVRRILKPGGLCIIANPIGRFDHVLSYAFGRPRATLTRADHPTSCWVPNIPCLMEMPRRAGFARVTLVTRRLLLRRVGRQAVPHAVVHAFRD